MNDPIRCSLVIHAARCTQCVPSVEAHGDEEVSELIVEHKDHLSHVEFSGELEDTGDSVKFRIVAVKP